MQTELQDYCVEYRTLYCARHDFRLNEHFHPDQGHVIIASGWRVVVEAIWNGQCKRAEACLGLPKEDVVAYAKDLARASIDFTQPPPTH